jgi:hypothetical protein
MSHRDPSAEITQNHQRMNLKNPITELENMNPDVNSDDLSRHETNSNSTSQSSRQLINKLTEDDITFDFRNQITINPTFSKLSKSAKNLMFSLLKDIEEKHLLRTKGIPINFSKFSLETANIGINTEETSENQPSNSPVKNDIKLILERLNQMETKITANNELIQDIQKKTSTTAQTTDSNDPKSFAKIVANSLQKNSLIIKPKQANETPRIFTQLQKITCPKNIKILNIRTDKDKIAIKTNNETEKNNLKDFLSNQPITSNATIEDKTPTRRRVIFYNIPDNITEENIKDIINENFSFTIDIEDIQLLFKLPGQNDKEHWVFQMPRTIAIELTKNKYIQNGFQRLYLKKYLYIPRCTKCNVLNRHTAKNCSNKCYCSNCSENHHYTQCNIKTLQCVNCVDYNKKLIKAAKNDSDPILEHLRDINHSAASYICPTYLNIYDEIITNRY